MANFSDLRDRARRRRHERIQERGAAVITCENGRLSGIFNVDGMDFAGLKAQISEWQEAFTVKGCDLLAAGWRLGTFNSEKDARFALVYWRAHIEKELLGAYLAATRRRTVPRIQVRKQFVFQRNAKGEVVSVAQI